MATVITAGNATNGLSLSADNTGAFEFKTGTGAGTTALSISSAQVVTMNGGAVYPLTSGTAVASTSGTSIDFTSIPSWVKRITVMFNGVSTNGTSLMQVQIGSGSITTSGYSSTASYSGSTAAQIAYLTTGFVINTTGTSVATMPQTGCLQICLFGSNTYIGSGTMSTGSSAQQTNALAGSSPALSGALDRVRVTTVNGTDTFDAGSINILYE